MKSGSAMVHDQNTNICEGRPESPAERCERDCEQTAHERSYDQDLCQMGCSGDAADSRHEFDIARAHAAGKPENQEDRAADQPGYGSQSRCFPPVDAQPHEQAKNDDRQCQQVRDSAGTDVKKRTDRSAQRGQQKVCAIRGRIFMAINQGKWTNIL